MNKIDIFEKVAIIISFMCVCVMFTVIVFVMPVERTIYFIPLVVIYGVIFIMYAIPKLLNEYHYMYDEHVKFN